MFSCLCWQQADRSRWTCAVIEFHVFPDVFNPPPLTGPSFQQIPSFHRLGNARLLLLPPRIDLPRGIWFIAVTKMRAAQWRWDERPYIYSQASPRVLKKLMQKLSSLKINPRYIFRKLHPQERERSSCHGVVYSFFPIPPFHSAVFIYFLPRFCRNLSFLPHPSGDPFLLHFLSPFLLAATSMTFLSF